MNRRHFLSLLPLLLGGCTTGLASRPPGENASYAFFNPSYSNGFEMARIDTRTGFLNEAHDINPLPPGSPGWSGGGPMQVADNGHRVPEQIWVSWRLPPRADQQRFEGDKVGPFRIALRSQIPPEVLLAANKDFHIVEMALSVGVQPVRLRWRLIAPCKDGYGNCELVRGGDWRLPQPGE